MPYPYTRTAARSTTRPPKRTPLPPARRHVRLPTIVLPLSPSMPPRKKVEASSAVKADRKPLKKLTTVRLLSDAAASWSRVAPAAEVSAPPCFEQRLISGSPFSKALLWSKPALSQKQDRSVVDRKLVQGHGQAQGRRDRAQLGRRGDPRLERRYRQQECSQAASSTSASSTQQRQGERQGRGGACEGQRCGEGFV